MKLYAIEITDENVDYIVRHTAFTNPKTLRRIKNEKLFLIASYNGVYEALCYIEADGFAREFNLAQDLEPGRYTEVIEL